MQPRRQLKRYHSRHGESGVTRYALGSDHILVEFRSHELYRYDYKTPGRAKVQTMKRLAAAGSGLATFINQHVREAYARKLH